MAWRCKSTLTRPSDTPPQEANPPTQRIHSSFLTLTQAAVKVNLLFLNVCVEKGSTVIIFNFYVFLTCF